MLSFLSAGLFVVSFLVCGCEHHRKRVGELLNLSSVVKQDFELGVLLALLDFSFRVNLLGLVTKEVKERNKKVPAVTSIVEIITGHLKGLVIDFGLFITGSKRERVEHMIGGGFVGEVFGDFLPYEVLTLVVLGLIVNSISI